MRRNDKFRVPPRRSQRRRRKTSLRARAAGEYKLPIADRHTMQLWRVVQAEKPALHLSTFGELGDHRCQVPSDSLDPAGWFELGKEANNHAQSLPTAATEGKARFAKEVTDERSGKRKLAGRTR